MRVTISNVRACTWLAAVVLSGPAWAADYLVDANYGGVDGAAFGQYAAAYKTVAAALGSTGVPSGASAANPNRVYFADGTYNTAKDTGVSLSNSRNNLALIGLSGNPDKVVITSTLDSAYVPAGGSALGTTGSSTLQLKGNNVSAFHITFGNSTNTPYIQNVVKKAVTPQGTYDGNAQTSNAPAVALLLQGDQQAFQNCKFLGYQDTLYTKGGRSFFNNCTVSGDIDFIFANGTTVFKNSTINFDSDHSGGTIFAASTDKRQANGMVVIDSKITGNSVRGNPVLDPQNAANANPTGKNMNIARPWGWQQVGGDSGTVLVNTTIANVLTDGGYLTWNTNETNAANGKNGGNPAKDARFAEYNTVDENGNPVNVANRVAWSHQLTASQAAMLTVENIFAGEAAYSFYGLGYTGSADPNSPNFSWPAYWGDRNSNNDTANATVSATYPNPGNPTAYTNPNWTLGGSWDPFTQLTIAVPEPTGIGLVAAGGLLFSQKRRGR